MVLTLQLFSGSTLVQVFEEWMGKVVVFPTLLVLDCWVVFDALLAGSW